MSFCLMLWSISSAVTFLNTMLMQRPSLTLLALSALLFGLAALVRKHPAKPVAPPTGKTATLAGTPESM